MAKKEFISVVLFTAVLAPAELRRHRDRKNILTMKTAI